MGIRLDAHRLASVSTLERFATDGERGRTWYAYASNQVMEAAKILGIEPQRLADLLALFSPRVSVKRSIRHAIAYIESGEHAHDVKRTVIAAVEHYENTGVIRGPKTAPFARALTGDLEAIVLDVWMARALGIPQDALNRKATHEESCKRIRRVANQLDWQPVEVQAAIWTTAVKQAGKRPGNLTLVRKTLWGDTLETVA